METEDPFGVRNLCDYIQIGLRKTSGMDDGGEVEGFFFFFNSTLFLG